jgi:peroxiredoxin
MALTYTPEGSLGSRCADFDLPSVDGKHFSLRSFAGRKALIVMFICSHCPYVKAIEDRLIALARDLQPRGVGVVGICSNDSTEYPEDRPEALLERWREKGYGFPYLIDSEQTVAKAFGAVCTPDLYVYGSDQLLKYRGRLDDSWRNPNAVQKQELREAVEALLSGRLVSLEQNPSMGCSIKWRVT